MEFENLEWVEWFEFEEIEWLERVQGVEEGVVEDEEGLKGLKRG